MPDATNLGQHFSAQHTPEPPKLATFPTAWLLHIVVEKPRSTNSMTTEPDYSCRWHLSDVLLKAELAGEWTNSRILDNQWFPMSS